MNKYRYAYAVGLQSNLAYRWNFAVRGLLWTFSLAVTFILWGAVYAGGDRIGGFSLRQTLAYFVLLIVLQFFIGAFNEDHEISEDIRNGLINQFLVKPVDYYLYRLSLFAAARTVSGLVVIGSLVVAAPFLAGRLSFPHEAWRIALGAPAALLAALIQFNIAYCFGLVSFWLLEIQGLVLLSFAVENILGGQIFPLDLLPPAVLRVAEALPFYYQMYFPAAILSGRIDAAGARLGLGVQCAWAAALTLAARFVWRRGLRRHTAVGG